MGLHHCSRWLATMYCACVAFLLVGTAPAHADARWLLVSDIHRNPFDRATAPSRPGADSNPALLNSAIARMRLEAPDPAVVVIAGDFLAHHFDRLAKQNAPRMTLEAAELQTMASIARQFGRTFPRARFLIALGNNDDPCGDYRSSYASPYLRALAKIWAPLVDRNDAAPGFARDFSTDGAYVAALPIANLRVVVVNSVYWSWRANAACSPAAAGNVEFAWLDRTLAATPAGERNLIVMHVPPGIDGYSTAFVHGAVTVPFLHPADSARLIAALANPGNRVDAALAGHAHELELRALDDVPMLVVPSISPIYGRAPSFFVATMAANGTLADYTAEIYDYATASWRSAYDFNRVFGVHGIDARSIAAIHARMTGGWRPPAAIQTSTDRYARCAQTEMTAARFDACTGNPAGRVDVILAAVALALAAAGLAIFLLVFRRVLRVSVRSEVARGPKCRGE